MSFDFATAGRILFGNGMLERLPELGKECGIKPFVLTGGGNANIEKLIKLIESIPQSYIHWTIEGEPTIEIIQEAVANARNEECDYVIGFGGGSVVDSGKAVAIMLTNSGEIFDYMEVVGKNQPLTRPAVPYIAIPTTAGTGSEVTRNAVLTVSAQRLKVSMRSPLMLPKIALIDPSLTFSLPGEVTAYTGMDALTQVIEPFVSVKRNDLTDLFCREGIKRATRSLRCAYEKSDDLSAREDMSYASLMGGLSLANAGLGMVHGFAGVIGGMFNEHHGAICASLLPAVVEVNIKALMEREPENPALARYQEIAMILTGIETPKLTETWKFLQALCFDLKIPRLQELGIEKKHFGEIIAAAQKASSSRGNPVELSPEELNVILEKAY